MVIIDGPDGGGKSTFIKYLRDNFDQKIIKPYYPKVNQLRYYLQSGPLYQYKWLERYYPSEMVYPRAMPDRTQMENYKQFIIEASIMPFNPAIIYLRPPIDDIKENVLKTRGDDYVKEEDQIEKIVWEYDKFMERTRLPVFKYDYTKDDIDLVYDNITADNFGEKYDFEPYPLDLLAGDPYPPKPGLMIIGEEPSNKSLGQGFLRPFISDTGSSLFLHECLYEAGVYRKEMPYFTNFYKFSSDEVDAKEQNIETFYEEVQKIRPRRIICLGKNIYDEIKKLSLKSYNIKGIEHPSYISRFMSGKEGKKIYIDKIIKAIL